MGKSTGEIFFVINGRHAFLEEGRSFHVHVFEAQEESSETAEADFEFVFFPFGTSCSLSDGCLLLEGDT